MNKYIWACALMSLQFFGFVLNFEWGGGGVIMEWDYFTGLHCIWDYSLEGISSNVYFCWVVC